MSDEPVNGRDKLVVRAKSDRDAMGQLYDCYYPTILRYCIRRLLARDAAEDATSEVFLQVAKAMRQFAGTTDDDFRCWIFRIATNTVNAHLRRTHRRDKLLRQAAPSLGQLQSAEAAEAHLGLDWPAVAKAILELDLSAQSILALRYVERLSHEQIAAVVRKRPGTVRTILSRTLARLRARFAVERDPVQPRKP